MSKLKWENSFAHTPFGLFYHVEKLDEQTWILHKNEGLCNTLSIWSTEESAMEAAQYDYKSRLDKARPPVDWIDIIECGSDGYAQKRAKLLASRINAHAPEEFHFSRRPA